MGVESGRGRWCSGANEVVVVVGHCVCKCEVGEGAEGQKYKIKPLGLNLGAPSEMGVQSDEGRWHGGADEVVVVVVVGHCVHKCEVGESVCAKKLKPSRRGSISGAPCKTAKGDSGEGWCGGVYEVVAVVGLCACKT